MPVVDASVVVDWVAPGVGAEAPAWTCLRHLVDRRAELVAPAVLHEEVGDALLAGVRRGRWSAAAADRAFAALRRLPVRLEDDATLTDRAWELARRHDDDHPLAELLYVALAEREGTELVTADAGLRRSHSSVVRIVAPGRL
jgi:predicted nucleic acid-binding protein